MRTASFEDLLYLEAIELLEDQAPLDDEHVMAKVMREQDGDAQRMVARARLLVQRYRLDEEWRHWRSVAWWVALGLLLLAYMLGGGLVAVIAQDGRTINAAQALMAVLGLPTFTLALWLFSLLWTNTRFAGSGFSFARTIMQLAAKWSSRRSPHTGLLVRAMRNVLHEYRLSAWVVGGVSHILWTAAFVLVFVRIFLLFSFQSYSLQWESTIQDADFFSAFVRATGRFPGVLGFDVPQQVPLNIPLNAQQAMQAAWWLLGCTVAYGLLPRVLVLVGCIAVGTQRSRAFHVDLDSPAAQKLLARFAALEPAKIVDEEHAGGARMPNLAAHVPAAGQPIAAAVLGFELPQDVAQNWPPASLPLGDGVWQRLIQGSQPERRKALESLATMRPRRLLLVCDAASSPDRGTLRFVKEALNYATHMALLPLRYPRRPSQTQRWAQWLQDQGLSNIHFLPDENQALPWLHARES